MMHIRIAASPRFVREGATRVNDSWAGGTGAWFLSRLAVGHSYIHLSEATLTRSRLAGRTA